MESWGIASVTVQNDQITVGLDQNLPFKDQERQKSLWTEIEVKDKQRVLGPVGVAPGSEISGRNFCKGENCNIPDPETLIGYLFCTYHALNACTLY